MTYPAARPPDSTRHALAVARALTIGLRAWKFYPPEHPALALAIERLSSAIGEATAEGPLLLAVTPQTLMVDNVLLDADTVVAECARLLHDVDLLQLSFLSVVPDSAIRTLLGTLTLDRAGRRARGGPAAIWDADGHVSIVVEQIDYQELLEREEVDEGPARRDVLWHSIVRSIIAGRRSFPEAEQQRLLEISRNASAMGELADECRSAYCSPDGSPLLTTQAAAVMAVYRHIGTTVGILEPDRASEVMGNFAAATTSLEPALAMEVLRMQESRDEAQPMMAALRETFDEHQVATLLARALAKAGDATSRLSQMLNTMAPDEDRRRRVLRLADKLLTERDFGSTRPINDIRNSLQELLLKYDESPYVSDTYSDSMERANDRATEMAARDLPPELDEWMTTLGHDNVRELSGQLLIDLLNLETIKDRAADLAGDMRTFGQDLLLAGAYAETTRIVEALRAAATAEQAVAADACRAAILAIAGAPGVKEAIDLLGELSPQEAATVERLCVSLGPAAVPAVLTGLAREEGGLQAERSSKILITLGTAAIAELTAHVDGRKWWVQREIARVLGEIGTAAVVPGLQTLLRGGDVRVLSAVVPALAGIDDPSAARAIATVLRSSSGPSRRSVVDALVTIRDARVVPLLARLLEESQPLGRDFEMAIETLDVVATFNDERAVRAVRNLAQHHSWFAPRRTRRLRERSMVTLIGIGTPGALTAIDMLAETGDRQLRRLAAAAKARVRTVAA